MNNDDRKPVRSGSPESSPGSLPDWMLERYARGELPPERAAEVRRRLEAEGQAGAARLAALQRSDGEILAAHPPQQVAAEVRRRLALVEEGERAGVRAVALAGTGTGTGTGTGARGIGRIKWTLALPTLAVGVAGMVAVVAVGRDVGAPEGGGLEVTTLKGLGKSPRLAVYRKRGEQADRLAPGAVVRSGDQMQLSYVAHGRRFGVVASVDAQGMVSLHLPETPGSAAELSPKGETMLPHAFELTTPGTERFVFVSSDKPFSTETVIEALRPGGSPLPGALTAVDLTLRKAANKDTQ